MNNDIEIDWRKYVDHIYLVSYTKTTNDYDLTLKELKRLGMYDIDLLTIMTNISTPFYKSLYDNFCLKQNYRDDYYYGFDATMAHYFCIKQAYELGYDHIMILENDVCFLKKKQYIKNILDSCYSLYDRYDTFVLDNTLSMCYFYPYTVTLEYVLDLMSTPLINKYIGDDDTYSSLLLCGCNIYNRSAMTYLISLYESFNFVTIDIYNKIYNEQNNKIAYSWPPICIQQNKFIEYDTNLSNLYTLPIIDWKYIINFIKSYKGNNAYKQNILVFSILVKNGYEYIKKYYVGYQNDEDFKYIEKLYDQYVLEQDVSFDDMIKLD